MYRVDRRIHQHKRARRRIIATLSLVLFVAAVYGLVHLRITPQQNIENSPPVSKAYLPNSTKKVSINKPEFTLGLPAGWTEDKLVLTPTSPHYSMRSPSANAQQLQIYIDNPPQQFVINKAIAVSASGDGVSHDSVSDNCTTYTDESKVVQPYGYAPAKWQGIDFYCDVANFARAVVGTVSKDGFNYFNAVGPTTGVHKVFITYTDNNITPDYTVLYDILSSLHFK